MTKNSGIINVPLLVFLMYRFWYLYQFWDIVSCSFHCKIRIMCVQNAPLLGIDPKTFPIYGTL